jgi:hypothetical protein
VQLSDSWLAACSLAELVKNDKLQAHFVKRILEALCTKVAAEGGKAGRNSDSACIAIKAIVPELPAGVTLTAADACTPALQKGAASVRFCGPPHHTACFQYSTTLPTFAPSIQFVPNWSLHCEQQSALKHWEAILPVVAAMLAILGENKTRA